MANIKINEEKFIKAMNTSLSSVGLLTAKYSNLFKTGDAVYKIINAESEKIHTFNRTIKPFLEEWSKIWSKIDLVAITNNWNKILQEALDDYNQVVESFEEDKWSDYYHLIKEHSTHVEKHLPYVTDDFEYFLKFYVPYNIRFLGLNKYNHSEKKYELYLNDLNLYHQYMNQLTNEQLSEEEALEIVWNKYDNRNTVKINVLSPPAETLNIKVVEEKNVSRDSKANTKQINKAKHYIAVFDGIYKVQKDVKKAIFEFESKEISGFSEKTLGRAIKTYYNDNSLTIRSYVNKYLSDKLTDKK